MVEYSKKCSLLNEREIFPMAKKERANNISITDIHFPMTVVISIIVVVFVVGIAYANLLRDVEEIKAVDIDNRLAKIEFALGIESSDLIPINSPVSYELLSLSEKAQHSVSGSFSLGLTAYATFSDFEEDEIVATMEDGSELTLSDLKGMPFCYKYYEGEVEHWFYGTLNGRGEWDGETILIEYIDNELVGLKEATYRDGKLDGLYKQFNREGENYRFTERVRSVENDFDSGETFVYGNVTLPIDMFKSKIPLRYDECKNGTLKQYYKGNVSNKKYHDLSGEAFLINYDDNETVRVFYSGNIENGKFKDESDNAFWICLTNDGSQYTYYKGKFANNNPTDVGWLGQPYSRINHDISPSEYLPPRYNYLDLNWKTW